MWLCKHLVFVLICLAPVLCAEELPRGVHPANGPFYDPLESFTCLDNSATLPWRKVNDDYCDCLDGSDEPGTAACPNMQFYCLNTGYQGAFIPSSFVDDDVCDCCDGSDEYNSNTTCPNTCGDLAAKKELETAERRKKFEDGQQIYNSYVERKAIELQEQAKWEAVDRARLEEQERQRKELEDSTRQPPTETTPMPETTQEPIVEEGGEEEEPEQDDDQYPVDKKSGDLSEEHAQAADIDTPADISSTPSPPPPPPPVRIDYGPDNGFMMLTEPTTGCLEVEDKEYIYSLCTFKECRQRPRHQSPGGGTLLGSWGRWVEHPADSIDWERQRKLEQLPYREMLYDGGESCWNGPSRSVRVKVSCGALNKLISAEEPSRCTYIFKLQTPAACHHHIDQLLEMHTEL